MVVEDRDGHKLLMDTIREKGRAFVEKRLADTENPIIFIQKQLNPQRQSQPDKQSNNATTAKETTPTGNSLPSSTAKKGWRDPPPLKAKARPTSKFSRR